MQYNGAQTQTLGFHLGKSTWPRDSAEFDHLEDEGEAGPLWKKNRVGGEPQRIRFFAPDAAGERREYGVDVRGCPITLPGL